jgi:Uma2 family endonuclease
MNVTELARSLVPNAITYPDSDGKPMADNSLQFRWITTIEGNLEILFEDDPHVLVAGDMLWYPVEGANKIRTAPDVMVIFGRPKGDRGSYQQWREGAIAPQVVFEILSPGNTRKEMEEKFDFYTWYGVEEYYLYDPERGHLKGWLRRTGMLEPIAEMRGWRSPRLGIRFELEELELSLYYPDDRPFLTFVELEQARRQAEQARQWAEKRADHEATRAQQASARAEREAARAEREAARAEQERQRAEQEAAARRLAEEQVAHLEQELARLRGRADAHSNGAQ